MKRLVLCLMSVLLLAAGAAHAAEKAKRKAVPGPRPSFDQPMQVVIVRSSEKGCEPTCPEWIMAEGMITAETLKAFQQTLVQARLRTGGAALPVILHSTGGNILAALQIGYFLRAQSVDVAVSQTAYAGGCGPFGITCSAPGEGGVYRGRLVTRNAHCLSACPLILASGTRRLASGDTVVGVHHWGYEVPPGKDKKPRFKAKKQDTPWDGVVRKMMSDYLTSMGISLDVVSDMNKTPFTAMKLYNSKRRKALKLVSEAGSADSVAAIKLCKQETPATSCVRAKSAKQP